MKSLSIILNKWFIIFSNLLFLITISTYPLFNFASQFKYNVAALITLLANQQPVSNNSLFNSLISNHGYVNYFILGIILILQLTYLIPLFFLKKPFSIAMLNFYQLMMNTFFILGLGFFFNWFNFSYFNSITISKLLIVPFILISLNFLFSFNFAVLHLTKNSYSFQNSNKNQIIKVNPLDSKDLTNEQVINKINELKSLLK